MKINQTRPMDELRGRNRGVAEMLTDRVHVSLSGLQAVRVIRAAMRTPYRDMPVALRRGLVKCVIEQHFRNQRTYEAVAGRPLNSQRVLGANGRDGIGYAKFAKQVRASFD